MYCCVGPASDCNPPPTYAFHVAGITSDYITTPSLLAEKGVLLTFFSSKLALNHNPLDLRLPISWDSSQTQLTVAVFLPYGFRFHWTDPLCFQLPLGDPEIAPLPYYSNLGSAGYSSGW
jgi:hypothetical protein